MWTLTPRVRAEKMVDMTGLLVTLGVWMNIDELEGLSRMLRRKVLRGVEGGAGGFLENGRKRGHL